MTDYARYRSSQDTSDEEELYLRGRIAHADKDWGKGASLRLLVRRMAQDIPHITARRTMAVFCPKNADNFVYPVMRALRDDFEFHRIYGVSARLLAEIPRFDVLWIEWGSSAYLLNYLRSTDRKTCKIVVRLIDWEIRDESHIRFPAWDVADLLIFINEDGRHEFLGVHPHLEPKTVVCPGAIDEGQFPLFKNTYGKRILLASLDYAARKNYLRAIHLFRDVVQTDSEFELVIRAAPGAPSEYATQCFQAIQELQLTEHVHFIMPLQGVEKQFISTKLDIWSLYEFADVILSSSDHEAFHYCVGEGMLSGLYPVVYPWAWGKPERLWGPYVVKGDQEAVDRILAWGTLSDEEKRVQSRDCRDFVIATLGLEASRQRLSPLLALGDARPERRKRVILFAHNHLYHWSPHGGELSMRRILRDLVERGYDALVVVQNRKNREVERDVLEGIPFITLQNDEQFAWTAHEILKWWEPDVAITWGLPARDVASLCIGMDIPYVLFVRYWHLLNPPPYVHLLTDPIDEPYRQAHRHIFEGAARIVTNAAYVSDVVRRFHAVDSTVAYVPVEVLPALSTPEERRYVTLINARKAGGGKLIKELAHRLPELSFLIVDGDGSEYPPNVTIRPYANVQYNELLRDTSVLLFPFDEDPCGTGRVAHEAQMLGIPVISVDKGGLKEAIPAENLVSSHEDIDQWIVKIRRVLADYARASQKAHAMMEGYSGAHELDKVYRAVEEARTHHQPNADLLDDDFILPSHYGQYRLHESAPQTGNYALCDMAAFDGCHCWRCDSAWRNDRVRIRIKAKSSVLLGSNRGKSDHGYLRLPGPPFSQISIGFGITSSRTVTQVALLVHQYFGDGHAEQTVLKRVKTTTEVTTVRASAHLEDGARYVRIGFYNHQEKGYYDITDFRCVLLAEDDRNRKVLRLGDFGFVAEPLLRTEAAQLSSQHLGNGK